MKSVHLCDSCGNWTGNCACLTDEAAVDSINNQLQLADAMAKAAKDDLQYSGRSRLKEALAAYEKARKIGGGE